MTARRRSLRAAMTDAAALAYALFLLFVAGLFGGVDVRDFEDPE